MRTLLTRLAHMLFVLWVVATILFFLFRLMPGDPTVAYIDTNFTEEQVAQLQEDFGLDRPLHEQYFIYLENLAVGEFGNSFHHRRPVIEVLASVLPNTIVLTLTGLIIAYIFGVLVGAWLAWQRGSWFEGCTIPTVLTLRAAPEFWLGMILLAVFSFQLGWFPSGGANSPGAMYTSEWARLTSRDFLWHLVLPAATLALYLQGLPLLLMRSNMLDVMSEDFITMARMKGLSQWTIVIRHAARNALLPVATAFALGFGASIGGNVVVETVFSWPGLGKLLVGAVAVERLSGGAGRVLHHHGRAGQHEFHRRPALHRARSAGVAWQARLTPRSSRRRRACRASRRVLAPLRDPYAAAGILIYMVFVLVALFADLIATHDPLEILFDADGKLRAAAPPGADHVLGTTNLGRDIFSQLIIGTRAALYVGLTAAVVVALIGTVVGLVSGYFGGLVDSVLMRLADVALGIPFLPFVIVLAGFLGPRTSNVILGIALLLWPNTGARDPLAGADRARARLRGGRAGDRRVDLAHPVRACRAQHPAAHLPLRLDRDRLGDPDRGLDLVPRLRAVRQGVVGLHAAGRLCEPGALARRLQLVRAARRLHRAGRGRGLLHQPRL